MSTNSNKEKLIAQAQKLVEKNQFDKAIKEYLKIAAEDENDIRIWIRIGDLYVKLGQKGEAIENYRKVAQLYSRQSETDKAIAVYKQILHLDAQSPDIHIALGALYRDAGRIGHATQMYEQASQLLTKQGKAREALAIEQTLVDIAPDNVARRIKLAELYSRENQFPDAAREFEKAAGFLRNAGRMDDFARVGERLLFHAPENIEMGKDLARYYLQSGDAPRALTRLQAAFKSDPRDVELLDLLAQAFEALKRSDKAVSVLKELARIYGERGASSAADSVNRRIMALDPEAETRPPTTTSGAARLTPRPVNLASTLVFNSPSPQPLPSGVSLDGPTAQLPASTATAAPGSGPAPGAPSAPNAPLPPAVSGRVSAYKTEPMIPLANRVTMPPSSAMSGRNVAGPASGPHSSPSVGPDPVPRAASPASSPAVPRSQPASGPGASAPSRTMRATLPSVPSAASLEALRQTMPSNPPSMPPVSPASVPSSLRTTLPIANPVAVANSSVSGRITPAAGSPATALTPTSPEEDAERVLAEAESFTKFGLAKKAVEHLQSSLETRPHLRPARERLAQLYAAQGQKRQAIAEWRRLASDRSGPQPLAKADEVRYLRELVRLDPRDADATARLRAFGETAVEEPGTEIEMTAEESQSRPHVIMPSVSASAAATALMPLAEFRKYADSIKQPGPGSGPAAIKTARPTSRPAAASAPKDEWADFGPHTPGTPPASAPVPAPAPAPAAKSGSASGNSGRATTASGRPAPAEVPPASQATRPEPSQSLRPTLDEPSSDEPVVTSGTLKEELDEVDFFLQRRMWADAKKLLASLTARYPHSKTVQAKLREAMAQTTQALAEDSGEELEAVETVAGDSAEIAMVNDVGDLPSMSETNGEETLQLRNSFGGVSRESKTDSSGAFRLGVSLRNRGQYAQAISEFQVAMLDPRRAGRAALMTGLCYRDQNLLREAIESFKQGVHMPGVSDGDLNELYYQLGRSYEQLGDGKEAVHFYQQAIQRDGRFKDAADRIAAIQQGRPLPSRMSLR